jgi:AAA15 family ATPase/GTPase
MSMLVLRFTLENHQSFRDEASLSLVDERLRTAVPQRGAWADYTRRVAAIYGANASGKSALLDGLKFMLNVISSSATGWSGRKRLPHAPFRLDENSMKTPSTYVLDFVLDGIRHEYGFSLTSERIMQEWLFVYPTGRQRILFEREGPELRFGRGLKGGETTLDRLTGPRELVLSRGAVSNNSQLRQIFEALTSQITLAEFDESNRRDRLRTVISEVADGSLDITDLLIMLRVADVGIMSAEVSHDEDMPDNVGRIFKAIMKAVADEGQHMGAENSPSMSDEDLALMSEKLANNLIFQHCGAGGKSYPLSSNVQSTGTLTWLSLAAPALHAIRTGGVLVIDELDASLHPQLAQVLVHMFASDEFNRRGAQIIFTTHDIYFMSPSSEARLEPQDIWLIEKNREGVSQLYPLSDFPVRSDQNLARRYLHGRYGAIPSVAPAFLEGIWRAEDDESTTELADR